MVYGRFIDRCAEVLGDWGPSLDADLRGLASASDSDAPDSDAPGTDAPDDRLHERSNVG